MLGTGAAFFIAVDWYTLERMHGRGPNAYTQVLTECGRFAHAALLAAGRDGAGAWMNLAIDEQIAADLCALDSDVEDALYMPKIGMPADHDGGHPVKANTDRGNRLAFDDVADVYDAARPGIPASLVSSLVNETGLRRGDRVLGRVRNVGGSLVRSWCVVMK